LEGSVLVIGGGVAGLQASLDLANKGIRVHLVEKASYIGGVMAQLDKTFPTMNCCICILEPKMIECHRHPNIEVHTLSEVVDVDGSKGHFKARIVHRPRHVDASSCTRCGACIESCPATVSDDFQKGFGPRKAVYIPFPQAVPHAPVIDEGSCLHFNGGCRACEEACPVNAIRLGEGVRVSSLNVSSIIVATGFQQYDPGEMGEYGYNRYENVITSLEFERLVSPYGPTGGELERPSDGKLAKRVAFVQCVGSRSHRDGVGVPYCSGICCMYTAKEAVTVKEKYPDSEINVFYIDIKAFGRDYQGLVNRARDELGVEYVRGKPGEIRENPLTKDLYVWYENTDTGEIGRKEVDLAVLSAAVLPRFENVRLASALGVELDEFGLFWVEDPFLSPLETTREGIYVCGCSHGPRDISDSVTEASAVALKAAGEIRLAAGGSGS
jgi:heterodisulfide reductase subunit A